MKLLTFGLVTAMTLSASSLVKTAQESGLQAIPTSKVELMKLIDNPKNKITDEKIRIFLNSSACEFNSQKK